MTNLEQQLLSALEGLSREQERQLANVQKLLDGTRDEFTMRLERSTKLNEALSMQVESLTKQVASLTARLDALTTR